jgi:ubiquinol oxidase
MISSIPIPSPGSSSKKTAASSYVSGGKVPDFVAGANKAIVDSIKGALFALYGERHYARFHALETIARVPYFAYTSVLHLYETLGWRRRSDLMKIHFAESWNELHHLLIMEELGGNKEWGDRVVAVHLAFFYYWVAIGLYIASPETAYNLNEQVRAGRGGREGGRKE